VEETLSHVVTERKPEILVYDRAADSDPLRARLKAQGVELVCPHRSNRKKVPTQDGRKLRRYKRRWIVERTIAWMQTFRRLITRFERRLEIFQAFFILACIMITIRRF
jgi:transposase